MHDSTVILQDVELRLRALAEARQLRQVVGAAMSQLQEAKQAVAGAEPGTPSEQQFLREAAEASSRLAFLREKLYAAERELRRTAYLLEVLAE